MPFRAWLTLACLLFAATPAGAHRSSLGSTAGFPIPSLTHGQMAVMAETRAAVLDLADRQPFQDQSFLRLRNFVDIQFMTCLWGLVPMSIEDETSPFNECSHAYLAGTQALLLYMQSMRGDQSAARRLRDEVNLEMLKRNATLFMCQYSGEPFNSADVIAPHWNQLADHGPTLVFFLAVGGSLVLGAAAVAGRALRYDRPEG